MSSTAKRFRSFLVTIIAIITVNAVIAYSMGQGAKPAEPPKPAPGISQVPIDQHMGQGAKPAEPPKP